MRIVAIIIGLLVIVSGGGCVWVTSGDFPPALLLFVIGGGLVAYAVSADKTKPLPVWVNVIVVLLGLALLLGAALAASLIAEFGFG